MDVVGTVMAGQPYNDILVWVDIDQVLSKQFATDFVTNLCREWSCLREVILTSENSATTTPCICFNIENHLEFIDTEEVEQSNISRWPPIMEDQMTNLIPQWKIRVINCHKKKTSRLYLRINHAYADGYTIIKMLTGQDTVVGLGKSKRSSFSLLRLHKLLWNSHSVAKKSIGNAVCTVESEDTKVFSCKSLKLEDVRIASKRANTTVTAILYTIMLLSYAGLTKKDTIVCGSTVTTSTSTDRTGLKILPLLFVNRISGKSDLEVLKCVSLDFATCKSAMYVGAVQSAISAFSTLWGNKLIKQGISCAMHKEVDLIFNSVIGPSESGICRDLHVRTTDIGFALAPGPICFNYISYEDRVNLTITGRGSRINDTANFRELVERIVDEVLYDVKV